MTDAELLQDYIQCKRIIHGAQRSPGPIASYEGAEPAPAEGSASAAAKPGQGLSDRPVIEAARI